MLQEFRDSQFPGYPWVDGWSSGTIPFKPEFIQTLIEHGIREGFKYIVIDTNGEREFGYLVSPFESLSERQNVRKEQHGYDVVRVINLPRKIPNKL